MWFICASSNNCTISPTDKWISRGGAHTVDVCTAPREEQGPPHMLRHVRLPHDRCPNLWQPAASQLNLPSFYKTIQTPHCLQQLIASPRSDEERSQKPSEVRTREDEHRRFHPKALRRSSFASTLIKAWQT